MATVGQPTSEAARRAQLMRDYWSAVRAPSVNVLGTIAGFFIAYPPLAQGIYYLLRGLWPLLRTSSAYSTPTDVWLSQSGGLLTLVIGATLCLAAYRRVGSPEVLLMAFGSAIGLTILELFFVFQGRISAIYLMDAFIQTGLVAFWVYGWRKNERELAQAARVVPAAAQPTTLSPTVAAVPVSSHVPS